MTTIVDNPSRFSELGGYLIEFGGVRARVYDAGEPDTVLFTFLLSLILPSEVQFENLLHCIRDLLAARYKDGWTDGDENGEARVHQEILSAMGLPSVRALRSLEERLIRLERRAGF